MPEAPFLGITTFGVRESRAGGREGLPDLEDGPAEDAPLRHFITEVLELSDQAPCRRPSLRRLDRHSNSRIILTERKF